MANLGRAGRFMIIGNSLRYKRFLADLPVYPLTEIWRDTSVSGFSEPRRYVVQTNPKVIARCLLMTTDPGDLVFDPWLSGLLHLAPRRASPMRNPPGRYGSPTPSPRARSCFENVAIGFTTPGPTNGVTRGPCAG